jgi:hypothetical protein
MGVSCGAFMALSGAWASELAKLTNGVVGKDEA